MALRVVELDSVGISELNVVRATLVGLVVAIVSTAVILYPSIGSFLGTPARWITQALNARELSWKQKEKEWKKALQDMEASLAAATRTIHELRLHRSRGEREHPTGSRGGQEKMLSEATVVKKRHACRADYYERARAEEELIKTKEAGRIGEDVKWKRERWT